MRFEAAAYSDRGLVKETNQDSVGIDIASTPIGDVALIVVADGMGGLECGELASATVVRELSKWFHEKLPFVLQTIQESVGGFEQIVSGQWAGIVQDLNLKIMAYGVRHQLTLGTTMTAMLAIGGRYTIAHVGDSRAYEITPQGTTQLTEDQTFVHREMMAGRMTYDEALVHPQRNVLLQCIGASKEVVPSISHHTLNKEATYLLCSDGYRHVLTEDELASQFSGAVLWGEDGVKEGDATEAARVRLARVGETVMERKEADNLSAAVLRAVPEGRL